MYKLTGLSNQSDTIREFMKVPHLTALILASAIAASATNFTYNTSIALSSGQITPGSPNQLSATLPSQTFNIQSGDTLQGTVNFTNGYLRIQGDTTFGSAGIFMVFSPAPLPTSILITENYSLTAIPVGSLPPVNTSTGTFTSASADAAANYGNGAPYDFLISGFTYSLQIASVLDASNKPTTQALTRESFIIYGINPSVVPTPEPASALLMACGFTTLLGLAKLTSRRRANEMLPRVLLKKTRHLPRT